MEQKDTIMTQQLVIVLYLLYFSLTTLDGKDAIDKLSPTLSLVHSKSFPMNGSRV